MMPLGDEWITLDGRCMRTCEMTEGHLANELALMRRRAREVMAEPLFYDEYGYAGTVRAALVGALDKLEREDRRRGQGPMRALAEARIRAGLAA